MASSSSTGEKLEDNNEAADISMAEAVPLNNGQRSLSRKLEGRHMQMIAIGKPEWTFLTTEN